MKEQYVGDVNDFRKYALLRIIAAEGAMRVGVCWMLTPPDGGGDGRKIGYLTQPKFAAVDPPLLACLREIVPMADGERLSALEKSGIVPGASYFNGIVPDSLEPRKNWFSAALSALSGCAVVFFDPDNGLDVRSLKKGRKGSSKYVYRDELEATFSAGHSVLFYQHFPHANHDTFCDRITTELQVAHPRSEVWLFRTAHVVFFLLIHPLHGMMLPPLLEQRTRRVPPELFVAKQC